MNELEQLKARLAQLEEQVKENTELKARLKKAETLNSLSTLNPDDWVDNKTIVVEVYGADFPVLKQVITDWGLDVHLPYKRAKSVIREGGFEDKWDQYIDRSDVKQGPLVKRGSDLETALRDSVTLEFKAFCVALASSVIGNTWTTAPVKKDEK